MPGSHQVVVQCTICCVLPTTRKVRMQSTAKLQNANPTPATPVLELYQFNTIQAVLLICAVNSLHELVMNAFCVVYFLTHTQTYKHTDIQTYKQPHKHIHTLHRSYNTQLSQDSFSSQLDITASFLILSIFIWRSVLLTIFFQKYIHSIFNSE